MQLPGASGLEGSGHRSDGILGQEFHEQMDVVSFSVDLSDQNIDRSSILRQPSNQVSEDLRSQSAPSVLRNKDDVVTKPIHAVCLTSKFIVRSSEVSHLLDALHLKASSGIPKILRGAKSTRDLKTPGLPSVITKALIKKYPKAKSVRHVTLPICADKGRQVRLVYEDGKPSIYVVCLRASFPVSFRRNPSRIRAVEFLKRKRRWFLHIQYDVVAEDFSASDVVGVDFNTRGNVATIAYGAGKVRRLGPDVGAIKFNFRKQRKRHQKKGHTQKAKKISGKQATFSRELNHMVSRRIVQLALLNRSAIALEDLQPRKPQSKIRAYTEKSQWSFFQLRSFIEYKAAILGIPIILIHPAYTSQTCSRCGLRNRPDGKKYRCSCGYWDHRDANAAHNIRALGKQKTMDELDRNDSYQGAVMIQPIASQEARTLEIQ